MNDASADKLILAVPSKGRLQENAAAFFARAGLEVSQGRGARDYRGVLVGAPHVEIAFVSASEIVNHLATGQAHLGVTGEDLIREQLADADERLEILSPLGFGHANVVVAAPEAWIDVRNMSDLEDVAAAYRARRGERMRVATKYVNLTRRYFAAHGVTDYRIVESLGATEGAPAAGTAEIVVDITTTGATLKANALKVLDDGVMLKSQANLVASLKADWSPRAREAARAVLSRIAAEEEARLTREVRARVASAPADFAAQAQARFASRAPFGDPVEGRVTLHCPVASVAEVADWLIGMGAERVSVGALAYVFCARNALYERLERRIG